jgi:lycopene elongase/hydratase (dihydrobisanhydrobacterioruberin-forming)
MTLKELIIISRPRFWLYEAATFALVGVIAAQPDLAFFGSWQFWVFSFYFLVPANVLIYGINDIFDYETDKLNPKKGTYEALVTPEKQKALWGWIIALNLPFLFFIPPQQAIAISFLVFLFCAVFYSATPIRAKARPLIDSLFSAGHYVATGVFGYYLAGGDESPLVGIAAGLLWAIAMHAYSAVPDIEADTKAGLHTIAILIGAKGTIMICWLLYLGAAWLVHATLPLSSFVGALVFSFLMYRSLKATSPEALFKIYTYFPLVNTLVGALVSIELFARFLS